MNVQICTATDPGLARNNNEDSVAFDAATGLCILADGMGGHNAGEIASGMATAFIKSEMRNWIARARKGIKLDAVEAALAQCITQANSAIYNMSRANHQYAGMGTTLVVGVFHGDGLVLAHIGDSRCYRLRDARLQQITKDHSIRQEQVDTGLVIIDPASTLGRQNLVTRALGVDENVQAEIHRHSVLPGDVYLMCTDGLSDMVSDEVIASIVSSADTLDGKAGQLVISANNAGGQDNISVLLAQLNDTARKPGLIRDFLLKARITIRAKARRDMGTFFRAAVVALRIDKDQGLFRYSIPVGLLSARNQNLFEQHDGAPYWDRLLTTDPSVQFVPVSAM